MVGPVPPRPRSLAHSLVSGMRASNNEVMRSMSRNVSILILASLTLTSCKDSKGAQPAPASGSASGSAGSADLSKLPKKPAPEKTDGTQIETVREKMIQAKEERLGDKDGAKGDKTDSEWVPAEFKAGMSRWKDTAVYVDGKPVGFLSFGELPIGLKPMWVKDKVSADKRPGTDDPGWRWAQQRFYKFTDYLKAVGVDIKKVNEIHVLGAKFSETIVATGKDLQSKQAEQFSFRFGGNTFGKAIPHTLNTFGNGKSPDKITSVMIYITKKPPKLVYNEGLFLDGVEQRGVPYYGEPIRGGVRVYLDDKLATIIKRQDLDVSKATKSADGTLHWNLGAVLAAQGTDAKGVVDVWLIRDELRKEKFAGKDLETLTFTASSQAKGGILIGDKNLRANSIALHTRAIDPSEIPVVTPDDE